MFSDRYSRQQFEHAEHRRITSTGDRQGTVHEVQKDKIRIVMGIRPDGSPWLSPWLHTTDHRGGSTERDVYKKGQNVRISAPGGDYRQATVTPWAESESFPAPAHADAYGANHKSFQMNKVRISSFAPDDSSGGGDSGGSGGGLQIKRFGDDSGGGGGGGGNSAHGYEVWIAQEDSQNPQHQDQSGSASSGSDSSSGSQSSSQQSAGTPAMKMRVHENGFITGRIGNDDNAVRFSAHSQGAKIRMGNDWVVVTNGKIIMSKPPVIEKDPVPNDND